MVKNRQQIKCLFKLKTSKGTFTQMSFFMSFYWKQLKICFFCGKVTNRRFPDVSNDSLYKRNIGSNNLMDKSYGKIFSVNAP